MTQRAKTTKKAAAGDWRAATLAQARKVIMSADAAIVETSKWRGVPVWECGGIICTGETYKDKVKLTFANGASLLDPSGLFNSSLDGNARRAIDLHEGETVNATAFRELVRAAVALNASRSSKKKSKSA